MGWAGDCAGSTITKVPGVTSYSAGGLVSKGHGQGGITAARRGAKIRDRSLYRLGHANGRLGGIVPTGAIHRQANSIGTGGVKGVDRVLIGAGAYVAKIPGPAGNLAGRRVIELYDCWRFETLILRTEAGNRCGHCRVFDGDLTRADRRAGRSAHFQNHIVAARRVRHEGVRRIAQAASSAVTEVPKPTVNLAGRRICELYG